MRPTREPFDPWATLGVARGADRAEIRRAYRRRARELHPDATGTDTTSAMAHLNRARDEALARALPGSSRPARPRPDGHAAGSTGGAGSTEGGDEAGSMPGYELEWDDYWSAWNDPPRRWRSTGSS